MLSNADVFLVFGMIQTGTQLHPAENRHADLMDKDPTAPTVTEQVSNSRPPDPVMAIKRLEGKKAVRTVAMCAFSATNRC